MLSLLLLFLFLLFVLWLSDAPEIICFVFIFIFVFVFILSYRHETCREKLTSYTRDVYSNIHSVTVIYRFLTHLCHSLQDRRRVRVFLFALYMAHWCVWLFGLVSLWWFYFFNTVFIIWQRPFCFFFFCLTSCSKNFVHFFYNLLETWRVFSFHLFCTTQPFFTLYMYKIYNIFFFTCTYLIVFFLPNLNNLFYYIKMFISLKIFCFFFICCILVLLKFV